MNYPDAFGQFYAATPTPAAMANIYKSAETTPSYVANTDLTNHLWSDYYQDTDQEITQVRNNL